MTNSKKGQGEKPSPTSYDTSGLKPDVAKNVEEMIQAMLELRKSGATVYLPGEPLPERLRNRKDPEWVVPLNLTPKKE